MNNTTTPPEEYPSSHELRYGLNAPTRETFPGDPLAIQRPQPTFPPARESRPRRKPLPTVAEEQKSLPPRAEKKKPLTPYPDDYQGPLKCHNLNCLDKHFYGFCGECHYSIYQSPSQWARLGKSHRKPASSFSSRYRTKAEQATPKFFKNKKKTEKEIRGEVLMEMGVKVETVDPEKYVFHEVLEEEDDVKRRRRKSA